MTYRVKLNDLAAMSRGERDQELTVLIREAASYQSDATPTLNARIRQFEEHYGMSSALLLEGLRAGEIRETEDISRWLFILDARDCRVAG